jgi:hypothetical protein
MLLQNSSIDKNKPFFQYIANNFIACKVLNRNETRWGLLKKYDGW